MKRDELIDLISMYGSHRTVHDVNGCIEIRAKILAEFDRLYELLLGCRNELAGLEDWEQSVSICEFIKQLNIELREWGKL